MRSRRWGFVVIGLGVALLVGSVAFRVAAAPALVRFPLNVDETAYYRGTALTYVDQATLLPLARPKREPLEISRRVKVASGTFANAVIDETVTVKTGGTTNVEGYQYVIDRRSMQMISDPRQYAFGDPKAVMHAAGAYRVNFAMGTNAGGSYLAYVPEEDAVSHLVLVEGAHSHPDAHISVLDFSSKLNGPVAPYYLEHLKKMGLPMQVSAAQLAPVLKADGIDVNKALADVGPLLTPSESALVTTTLAKEVPLHYFFLSNGLVSIEPKTGALIDVHTQQQGIAVQPDLRAASVLQPLFDKYAAIPSVKALSSGLAALAHRRPQVSGKLHVHANRPVFIDTTRNPRDNVRMMNLIEVRVPAAMGVLGLILLGVGLIGLRRSRRGGKHSGTPVEPSVTPTPIATEPITTPPAPSRTYEGV